MSTVSLSTKMGRQMEAEYWRWFDREGFAQLGWDAEKSAEAFATDIAAIEAEAMTLGADGRINRLWDAVFEAIQEGTITREVGDRLLGHIADLEGNLALAELS